MTKGLIGVQMMMLAGKVREMGAYAVLRKLAEMGFHCVEVSQIPMTLENVAAIRQASADFGIKIAACSAALESAGPGSADALDTDFDKIVADCRTLDCAILRIGMLPARYMGSLQNALAFTALAEAAADRLAERGIELHYHNHHVDFEKFGGKYLLDILRDGARRLGFELDVYWIQNGGENPINIIRQYAGRIKLIHLKDYRVRFDAAMPGGFSAAFKSAVQFAEVGEGSLPMREIIETGLASGGQYFIIEQDETYGRDPFDCLATSRDNLINLGYGDWFIP